MFLGTRQASALANTALESGSKAQEQHPSQMNASQTDFADHAASPCGPPLMKTTRLSPLVALLLTSLLTVIFPAPLRAQFSNISYQGRLNQDGPLCLFRKEIIP